MARRRKKKDVDLFEGLLGLSLVAVFIFVLQQTGSMTIASIAAGCLLGVVVCILVMRRMKQVEKLKKSGIADIDKMDGRQFEHYLGHLFKSHGYSVNVTKAAGDYGADLVISKEGKKIVVQAKRYNKNVGLKAVQEAHTAINHYGATEAWVVTNSGFTEQAVTLARSNKVKLLSRNDLIEMILKMNPGTVLTPKQVIEALPKDEIRCDRCGSQMIHRNGSRGEFYGCSAFPKCRNVKAV